VLLSQQLTALINSAAWFGITVNHNPFFDPWGRRLIDVDVVFRAVDNVAATVVEDDRVARNG